MKSLICIFIIALCITLTLSFDCSTCDGNIQAEGMSVCKP